MVWRISLRAFHDVEQAVRAAGYGDDIAWSESVTEPTDADCFAREAIFVICNSGMRFAVAEAIFEKVMRALRGGLLHPFAVFGHAGKADAIQHIWQNRDRLLSEYLAAPDKLAFCVSLPWIGDITKYHLAKNLGANVAKPDVHLSRLAAAGGETVQGLCKRLAAESGLRVATVDVILWRACATGIIDSRLVAKAA